MSRKLHLALEDRGSYEHAVKISIECAIVVISELVNEYRKCVSLLVTPCIALWCACLLESLKISRLVGFNDSVI